MKNVNVEMLINDAFDFGSVFVGSYIEECAERTNKMIDKIERYAKNHNITTNYVFDGNECYLKVKK